MHLAASVIQSAKCWNDAPRLRLSIWGGGRCPTRHSFPRWPNPAYSLFISVCPETGPEGIQPHLFALFSFCRKHLGDCALISQPVCYLFFFFFLRSQFMHSALIRKSHSNITRWMGYSKTLIPQRPSSLHPCSNPRLNNDIL